MSTLTFSFVDPPAPDVTPPPPLPPGTVASWTVQVTDRNGVGVGFLDVQSFRLRRRLNGAASFEAEVLAGAGGADALGVGDRMIRAYRRIDEDDAVIRFAGQITGPLTDEGDPDGRETVAVVAHDPFNVVMHRHRDSPVTFSTPTDQGAIVANLIAAENARAETGLRMGAYPASMARLRTYELGKNVGEAVGQLAEVLDGFWFTIDAADDGPHAGTFNLRWPLPGVERPAVTWQYGPETLGNLESVRMEHQTPVNRVLAFGAGEDDLALIVAEEDAASIARYGLWEKTISHTDVSVEATLRDHARDALAPEPVTVYQVQPALPSLDGPQPPRLFDDFDVGDTVHVLIRGHSSRLLAEDWATVTEAVVEYDADGNERLAELVLQAPITGRVRAGSRARLLDQLRDDARRIGDLERRG